LIRLLLNEPSPFPFVLPRLSLRSAEVYERAFRTSLVGDFFLRLNSLEINDPGYGDDADFEDMSPLLNFSRLLGRSVSNLQTLRLFGFEDSATTLLLPHITVPKLQSLRIVGACQTAHACKALLSLLRRVGNTLEELELNVWTELLYEADPPFFGIGVMPRVKRLMVRAPPCVPWEHFARMFPALEELTFLYHQEFSDNTMEVLDCGIGLVEQRNQLEEHIRWLYHDAVIFARDLHVRGFDRLAKSCSGLQEICVAVADTSSGYDVTPPEDRLQVKWRRSTDSSLPFRRKADCNGDTRAFLEA